MTVDIQHRARSFHAELRADARAAVALVAAVLAFAATAFAPQVLNDGDTFLHIAAGARMLGAHAILYRDPFSYTFANAPWQAHEWLAEVAMAAAYNAAGWSGLLLLAALASAAAAGLLAYHLGRWLDWPAQAIIVVLAMSCMTASLLARPHLLALPLMEVWIAELVIARSEQRVPSLLLLPVMTLWVNIHGTFLLGLALVAAYALEALLAQENRPATLRGWGVFGIGAAVAALLNPHFLSGIFFPVWLMGTSRLGDIGEWQPIDFSQLQPLELVVLAAIYFIVTRGVKIPPLRALIVLGLLHLALQHHRHQLVFAIAAPLALAQSLSLSSARTLLSKKGGRLAGITIAGTVAVLFALTAVRLVVRATPRDSQVAPITALAHVPGDVRNRHVLNDYSFGGYLIFAGVRPFVDSRAELYDDAFFRNYAQIVEPDPAVLKATLLHYDIGWTILGRHSPVAGAMDSLSGWHRLFADDFAVVHIRDK